MLEVGHRVECEIPGHIPGVDVMYVIGEPLYSEGGSHVVLADENAIGMPVNAAHCRPIACDCSCATWMRARYLKAFPGKLKPEQSDQGHASR